MKRYKLVKAILLVASLMIGGGIAHYYFSLNKGPVYDYNTERDAKAVRDIFKGDWYWLSNREWNPEITNFVIESGSPNEYEPRYFGKMKVKVLRENNKLVGFITYFMLNFYEGKILYLAIAPEFRGQHKGEILLQYALDDLFKNQGADIVRLVTRDDNVKAQKLYTRFGFEQVPPWNDDGFFHYVYYKKK